MTRIHFEKAVALSDVQTLAHEIWPECYRSILAAEQIAYMLDTLYAADALEAERRDGVRFWYIEEAQERLGFLALGPVRDGTAKLHKLYVRARARGRGVGAAALQFVEAHAGAERLTLHVNKRNARAMAVYEKAGFVRVGEDVVAIGGGFVMDDFVYEKKLRQGR